MSTAHIFPGQGSQYVGMGRDLCENSSQAKEIFHHADEILSVPLSKICFEGPEEELKQTKNTQPAIFLHSYAALCLSGNKDASMAAGHSLGEYTALVCAGALEFEDALRLVRLRGELMQKAGELNKGTMAAIVGLSADVLTKICGEASAAGIVQCANFNSPGQIVISGSVAGVRKAMELAKSQGARMVKELVVSGAFHSPLMQSACEGLREALKNTNIHNAEIPVYANVSASPVRTADDIRRSLEAQLTAPVFWDKSVTQMINNGAKMFIEYGPGKVLQGLVKRIDATVETRGVDTYAETCKLEGVS